MRIRFLSGNRHKIEESVSILSPAGVSVVAINIDIPELQTSDIDLLVREKTLKAFHSLGHPLFVEHTGLYLDEINGLPGGLTRVFWDAIGPQKICELFGNARDAGVVARTHIGYCDGRRLHRFAGQIKGRISEKPRGNQTFQWDCVFIPEGHDKTFAELGPIKNDISMRRQALDKLANHLREHVHA